MGRTASLEADLIEGHFGIYIYIYIAETKIISNLVVMID
jgi:hypothetical protein